MIYCDSIDGVEKLKKSIPENLQHWHKFGSILELNFFNRHIDEYYCDYTNMVELVLSDISETYKIKLNLYNLSGNLNFDMYSGFWSGFSIEEIQSGERKFHLYSFEQDIQFELYCEKIRAEII